MRLGFTTFRVQIPEPPLLTRDFAAMAGSLVPSPVPRVRALARALAAATRRTGSPGRGVVPGPAFFRRKDQPCSALTCWKNTLNDVPVLLSAVGNACSVPAPVPVLVAFSGLVVKNDDNECFLPL